MSDQKKDKRKKNDKIDKELDYLLCPKHNIRYPKGSRCPACESER